ncbi:adenosine kinase-like isoform X2 [Anneissia japonica]|uniref:adenosine kinase-like isoform X2 n=1 Tax=Anneissia japonica TaxID=1529436 RepID=UPI00142567C9|nr:adenosine kinase-like isoform X2 [Anneissia japonica]
MDLGLPKSRPRPTHSPSCPPLLAASGECCKEGCIASLGIPLLDMIANVTEAFLKRFSLEEDNSIQAGPQQDGVYGALQKECQVSYSAGGSAQNTIRIAQLMLRVPRATTVFGCIGKDHFGEILKVKGQSEGAKVVYQEHDVLPSGKCAVFITKQNRSLCADFGAAKHYTLDHLQRNWNCIEKASILYSPGYVVASCPEAVSAIARFASQNDKLFCLNLSAPYICTQFSQFLQNLMPYVDICFGNLKEFLAFSENQDIQKGSAAKLAQAIARLPMFNSSRNRTVVITQGDQPTILATGDLLKEYPVIAVTKENIKDTCGAGDAFVGGFLSQVVLGQSLDLCIKCGHYAASVVIQQTGTVIPDYQKFVDDWEIIRSSRELWNYKQTDSEKSLP